MPRLFPLSRMVALRDDAQEAMCGIVLVAAAYLLMTLVDVMVFVVFHDVRNDPTLLGAAVMATAGLYTAHRERVRRVTS